MTNEFDITQEERLSSFSSENTKLYTGDPILYPTKIMDFCLQTSNSELPKLAKLSEKFSINEMASPILQIRFLQFLVRSGQYKSLLEIGTFIGLTTLALSEALSENGKITTLEKGEEFAEIAKVNFSSHPLGNRIKLIQGDATEVLSNWNGDKFDFVYLDAAKQLYPQLFELCESKVEPGGLLVVDDIFFHGDALNDIPTTDKGLGTKLLVKQINQKPSWKTTILPIFNGMLLSYHLPS